MSACNEGQRCGRGRGNAVHAVEEESPRSARNIKKKKRQTAKEEKRWIFHIFIENNFYAAGFLIITYKKSPSAFECSLRY